MTAQPAAVQYVYDAIRALSGVCDGARTRDDHGFNGRDTEFGKSLAERPFTAWSPKMYAAAYKLLRTYKNTQLPKLGFDYARMVPRLPNGAIYIAAAHEQETDGSWTYGLWYAGELIRTSASFRDVAEQALYLNGLLKGLPEGTAWSYAHMTKEEAYAAA